MAKIGNDQLEIIALATVSSRPTPSYTPPQEPTALVSETVMRKIVFAIVLGSPMPRLITKEERETRDALEADIKKIHDTGDGVELPFEIVGEGD